MSDDDNRTSDEVSRTEYVGKFEDEGTKAEEEVKEEEEEEEEEDADDAIEGDEGRPSASINWREMRKKQNQG